MHAPAALHLEQTHRSDALLAVVTFLLGTIGLVLVAVDAAVAGMICGAVGVLTGLSGQLLSRTRPERFLDVIGLVGAAVAFAVGAAYGNLSFNG